MAPVEFKTKWREKVVGQLQAGADEANRHTPVAPVPTFRPVVALHRFRPTARRRLRERVAFRGQLEPIRVVMCGEALGKVFEA